MSENVTMMWVRLPGNQTDGHLPVLEDLIRMQLDLNVDEPVLIPRQCF